MVKIENKLKTLDVSKPHEYFYELFEENINKIREKYKRSSSKSHVMLKSGEINWMDTILSRFNLFVCGTIKKETIQKKFHDFIFFLERELWDLGQCLYDIDTIKYYTYEKVQTSKKWWAKGLYMLQKYYILLDEHVILKLSALFDREGHSKMEKSRKNLEQRYNFISYKKELDNIQDNSQKFYLNFLQEFIDILYDKVNEWRDNFNSYKHNYSYKALQRLKSCMIELQEIFNMWYIMYAFVLPMLKILHSYEKNNIFESFCYTSILFETDIEEICELLKKTN